MRKLRLDVEELAVDSFDTEAAAAERGTVLGHSFGSRGGASYDEMNTCAPMWSCDGGASCGYTCNNDDTCGGERTCDMGCPGEIVISFGWGA